MISKYDHETLLIGLIREFKQSIIHFIFHIPYLLGDFLSMHISSNWNLQQFLTLSSQVRFFHFGIPPSVDDVTFMCSYLFPNF